MLHVPEIVRNKAAVAGAEWWIDALPDLIAELESEWDIAVGRPYQGGTEAYVAEATRSDGTPAVLKLLVPRDRALAVREVTVLRLAEGYGCAHLFEADADRGAMLLERLGPSMFDLALPIEQRLPRLCDAASALWRRAPDADLLSGADKGRWLQTEILRLWDLLDRPCPERVIDHATSCAERRVVAHDDERSVLVHGDVHQWNALQSGDGFKLVDPDGLLAEAEYDLGIIMREDPAELMRADPRDRSRRLAARTGLDEVAIWEWGVMERVSTGLLCVQIGLQPVGSEMLAAAEVAAAHG